MTGPRFRDTDPRPDPERRPVSGHFRRPAQPPGYVEEVAEANRRAAQAYPIDGLLDPGNRDAQLARRNAYVAGYLAAWLKARA